MTDVFGGLGGDPHGDDTAWLSDGQVARLSQVLEGAAVLGAELEPTYRVLALTLEPTQERSPWGATGDRRVQLLASPVSTLLVSLRRVTADGTKELLTFEQDRLVDIVAALDGAQVTGPLFGRPEPRPGEWGPRFSLEGRSSAPDGTSRTLRVELAADELSFGLFARFDQVELRDAAGQPLAVPSG